MKFTALAVVILALGIVLGLALRPTIAEAAPKWATPQFVDDSIEAFNQAVVQPITATVGQLQGDVSDLDQRVAALEMPQGRLIELGTQTVGVGERYESALVDISDCGQETVMATAPIAASVLHLGLYIVSPDGVNRMDFFVSDAMSESSGGQATATHIVSVPFPFMSVVVGKAASQAVVDITAWIWCAP